MAYAILLVFTVVVGGFLGWVNGRKEARDQERLRNFSSTVEDIKKGLLASLSDIPTEMRKTAGGGKTLYENETVRAVQEGTTRVLVLDRGLDRPRGTPSSTFLKSIGRSRHRALSIVQQKFSPASSVGRLIVTDDAIHFQSGAQSLSVKWADVTSVDVLLDGVMIARSTEPLLSFHVAVPDPVFFASLELMLDRES